MPRTLERALSPRFIQTTTDIGMHCDGAGLYLRVTPRADGQGVSRGWIFRYRHAGRKRDLGLGPFPTVGLADARERARKARLMLLDGQDPIQHRREARQEALDAAKTVTTFKAAALRFLEVHEAEWKNAKHRQQWRNTLAAYAYPNLGSRPVATIDARLINETLAPIWRDRAETAGRVKQRIERVVAWVKAGMPLPVERNGKAHHPALPYEQIPAFMADLRSCEGIAARALEFVIICACRSGDVIGGDRDEKPPMQWSHVDWGHKVWTVPSTKTDTEHRIPLSARALEILRSLQREEGSDIVFAGGKTGEPLSENGMASVIKRMNARRTGLELPRWVDPKQEGRDVVPHGFRSSFRDWASEQTSFPPAVAEKALAHEVKDKTEGAYRRGDLLRKRRQLMDAWGRFCASTPRAAGGVVRMIRG